MHGHMNVKFVNAKHAKEIYRYRNTREKLYKTIAAIWYNKIWRQKQLTTNYISIKINGVSCLSKFGKLVHLVGFIINKFVTMYGHMNVKYLCNFSRY
jgi:hypothetical protein